jgi:hypothetical protein
MNTNTLTTNTSPLIMPGKEAANKLDDILMHSRFQDVKLIR